MTKASCDSSKPRINIVIPMAGAGSRFAKAGYADPKPLIPVFGQPMISRVIENLRPSAFDSRFIFLAQRTHIAAFDLEKKLKAWAPESEVIPVDGLTEGQACTVLLAKAFIDTDEPLLVANCDQYVDCDMDAFCRAWLDGNCDGIIMTMKANDPKWSFVGFDSNGKVERVVEKQVISDEATVGIYGFTNGRRFVEAAEEMIARNERVNNEFYVAPVYNDLIRQGASLTIWNIGSERNGMYGLGIPADLEYFLTLDWAKARLTSKKPNEATE